MERTISTIQTGHCPRSTCTDLFPACPCCTLKIVGLATRLHREAKIALTIGSWNPSLIFSAAKGLQGMLHVHVHYLSAASWYFYTNNSLNVSLTLFQVTHSPFFLLAEALSLSCAGSSLVSLLLWGDVHRGSWHEGSLLLAPSWPAPQYPQDKGQRHSPPSWCTLPPHTECLEAACQVRMVTIKYGDPCIQTCYWVKLLLGYEEGYWYMYTYMYTADRIMIWRKVQIYMYSR